MSVPLSRMRYACHHFRHVFVVTDPLLGCDIRHKSPCMFGGAALDFPMVNLQMTTRLKGATA